MNSPPSTQRRRAGSAGAKGATGFTRPARSTDTSRDINEAPSAPAKPSQPAEKREPGTSNQPDSKPVPTPSTQGSAPHGTAQQRWKVFKCTAPKEHVPLLTLSIPIRSANESPTLESIRTYLDQKLSFTYTFCLDDSSDVAESLSVTEYLDSLEVSPQPSGGASRDSDGDSRVRVTSGLARLNHIYVKETRRTNAGALASGNFLLKFVRKADGDFGEGSLLGTTLPADQWSRMTLGHLRPHIQSMSSYPKLQVFCYSDETVAPDSMGLEAYVKKAEAPSDIDSELPTFTVHFRRSGPQREKSQIADFVRPQTAIDITPDLKFDKREGERNVEIEKMLEKKADFDKLGLQAEDLAKLIPAEVEKFLTPGELDENQWQTVLRNCSVFHGWYIDIDTKKIKRAPRPAFRLKPGLNIPVETEVPSPELLPDKVPLTQEHNPNGQDIDSPKVLDISKPLENPTPTSRTDADETISDTVTETHKILGEIQPPQASQSLEDKSKPKSPPKSRADPPKVPELATPKQLTPKRLPSFPSFATSDDSRVEVAALSHELSISMAQNQFSITTLEVSASGSFAGFSASATGGFASSSSSGSGTSDQTKESTMFAKYKFPRATVYLHPEDLELTNDLKEAINKVQKSKNVDDLRVLQRTYGHFFCHEVLLGGCLQSTRTTKLATSQTWSEAKEQFKVHAGFSAGMPGVFETSVKSSHETGSSNEKQRQETSASDKVVFEATGGNTVLASDPPRWCTSVLDYTNWRVIERTELNQLTDAIARCAPKDYGKVETWFTQAIPALSDFVVIPPSRTLSVRLKLTCNIPGFTARTKDGRNAPVRNYLAHQKQAVRPTRMAMGPKMLREMHEIRDLLRLPGHAPANNQDRHSWWISDDVYQRPTEVVAFPLPNAVSPAWGPITSSVGYTSANTTLTANLTTTFEQVDNGDNVALFSPAQTQAPIIVQYEDNYQEADFFTTEKYEETLWQMVVMEGDMLSHGALVCLRSYNKDKKLHLSIYRNEQGHYLPAITTSGSIPFWRVFKAGSNLEPSPKTFIRDGENIRLCWSFSDQRAGFRDFDDDIYGRRAFHKPANTKSDKLFLKLPFPGFQRSDTNSGAAMIMSENSDPGSILQSLKVVPSPQLLSEVVYNLFDLNFRLDIVDELGMRELTDYMTAGLDQRAIRTLTATQIAARQAYFVKLQKEEDELRAKSRAYWKEKGLMEFFNNGSVPGLYDPEYSRTICNVM